MEPNNIIPYLIVAVVIFALVFFIRRFILKHMLGTFKYDNSGESYRCRFEFDSIDDLEKLRFAIVKVKEEDLSLPGERKSQHQQLL